MLILYKGHFFFFFFFFFLKEIRVDILQHFQDPLLNNAFQYFFFSAIFFFFFFGILVQSGGFLFLGLKMFVVVAVVLLS